jgi:hypothetical protein
MRLIFLLLLAPFFAVGQVKQFDKIEMLYDQGHYSRVLNRSNRLLDNPEFDFSLIPSFYKSLAMFQLYRDDKWRRRNSKAFDEAVTLFLMVKREDQGNRLFTAHYYEIQSLKKDLQSFALDLKQTGNEELFIKVSKTIKTVFSGIVGLDELEAIVEKVEVESVEHTAGDQSVRASIVNFAQKHVGVPYKPGGLDPKGFDCSGFTSYVFEEHKTILPRIARDQQKSARKIDMKAAQPGDLIFFNSGSGVNHVGIVVANQNGAIKMVHASTSQGVIITDVESSSYWNKRIHSVGSYID